MKTKKRGTMIKLIIIFIIIIASILTSAKYIKTTLAAKKNDDIKTNMLVLQAKVKLIKGDSDVKNNQDNYVGTKVSESNNQEIINLLKQLNISDEEVQNYFILNKEDFSKIGISENIKSFEDYYVINYDNAEIIYSKGLEIDNGLKYKLSEMVNVTE